MSLEQRYTVASLADYNDAGFNKQRNTINHVNNGTGDNTVTLENPAILGAQSQALTGVLATLVGDEGIVMADAPARDVQTLAFGDNGAGGTTAENQQVHLVVLSSFTAQL